MIDDTKPRCGWVKHDDEAEYHDTEWGVPSFDARHLFEMLTLEGAQAGLSWRTILRKRAGYRAAFMDFDARRVARFTPSEIERLMHDPSIVRNRLKIESTVHNARAIVELESSGTAFSDLLWGFVDHTPIVNHRATLADLPAQTDLSKRISKDLKKHGFRFVGPTVIYSFMQATGMVNDHTTGCHRYRTCGG